MLLPLSCCPPLDGGATDPVCVCGRGGGVIVGDRERGGSFQQGDSIQRFMCVGLNNTHPYHVASCVCAGVPLRS